MIDKNRRRPYWRGTKYHLVAGLIVPGLAMVLLPLLFVVLNQWRFLGFPLGYFAVTNGTVLIAIVAVLRFVAHQDAFDRRHGTHEDF